MTQYSDYVWIVGVALSVTERFHPRSRNACHTGPCKIFMQLMMASISQECWRKESVGQFAGSEKLMAITVNGTNSDMVARNSFIFKHNVTIW